MRIIRNVAIFTIALTLAACGSQYTGTYKASVRTIEGLEPATDPGYTLEEIRTRLANENRTLTLSNDKRYIWNTGSATLEGTWRIEGDYLYLRDDISNGNTISTAMRADREWRISPEGELLSQGYTAYNLEEYYSKGS